MVPYKYTSLENGLCVLDIPKNTISILWCSHLKIKQVDLFINFIYLSVLGVLPRVGAWTYSSFNKGKAWTQSSFGKGKTWETVFVA